MHGYSKQGTLMKAKVGQRVAKPSVLQAISAIDEQSSSELI